MQTTGRPVAHLIPKRFSFRCDSVPAQMAALRAAAGITACHVRTAERNPDLIPVLADAFSIAIEAWLVMHEDARSTKRVRVLFEHLAKELDVYVKGG